MSTRPDSSAPDEQPFEIEPERYELSEHPPYAFEIERRGFLKTFGAGLVVLVAARQARAQESGRGAQGRNLPADVSAWLHIDEAGKVTAYTGKTEIGQNIRTSLSQAIADELRLPLAAVTLVMADTDRTPFDQGTFGSQTTPTMAPRLSRAAATAREMLIDQAAAKWQVDRATLTAKDGRIASPDGRTIAYGELTKGQKLSGTVAAEAGVTAPPQ